MPRRKIITWAKISLMARQRYPEDEEAEAIALRDAFDAAEAAEYPVDDREAAFGPRRQGMGAVAETAARETLVSAAEAAAKEERVAEAAVLAAPMPECDDEDVDGLEDFDDEDEATM